MSDSDKQALIDGSATVQTEIVVHNENLFNVNSIQEGYYINTTTGVPRENSVWNTSYLIKVNPSTSYTLSNSGSSGQLMIAQYKANEQTQTNFITYQQTSTGSTNKLTVTTDSQCQYIVIGYRNDKGQTNIILEEGTPISLTETNSVIDWNHEDFRLVKEEGWIGQFVARQVTGNLKDLSDDFNITDKEIELKLGVKVNNNTNWYSLGNFLVTKVTNDEVNDKTSFEALDYTKKFNKVYVDRMTYPCTAGDLAQDVCDQCGVELGSTTFKNNDYVIEGNVFTNNESCRDVMKAIGKLAFSWVRVDWDNKVYIDFDPLPFKNQFDKDNANVLQMNLYSSSSTTSGSSPSNRTLYIPVQPNTTYTINKALSTYFVIGTTETTPTFNMAYSQRQTNNAVTSMTITTNATAHYLMVWYYNSADTLTEEEIINSIVIKQQPSQYETFGNNKYYNLKTQKEVFGPVDKVVIGYSAIEGEKTYIGEENGTCVINVLDNPLVFNQEQRAAIIESASDLLGFTYTPLNTLTVGHPWLKGNELVRVTDMESVSHDTFPLDRTIQYFGHIKTLINSTTETKTNDNLSYKPEMVKNYERSEIYNDQNNKQIGIIIEEQNDTNQRLNTTISTLDGTIQRVSRTETNINDIVTTTQVSTGKNHLYLEDAVEGNALSYSVDGATEQQTYSGKNLFNVTDYTNLTLSNNGSATNTKTSNEITITTGSGSTNSGVYISTTYLQQYIDEYDSTIDYYVSFDVIASQSLTLRIGSTTKDTRNIGTTKTRVSIQTKLASALAIYSTNNRAGDTIKVSNIMVSTNSDTAYEQYVGGTPSPNPDYPQEVKTIPSIINLLVNNLDILKANNTTGTWNNNVYTLNNLTFTYNEDGSITVNGTASGNTTFSISRSGNYKNITLPSGTYYFTSNELTGGNSTWNMQVNTGTTYNIYGTGANREVSVTLTNDTLTTAYLYIKSGSSPNNARFYPMITTKSGVEYIPYGYWSKVKITGKNIFDDDISNLKYSNSNNTLTQITNGVRATFTGTSSSINRYSVMLIKDSSKLLGKTYSLSGVISPSASNRGAIRIYQIRSDGGVSGGVVADTSTSNTFTFPSTFRSDAVGFGIIFYSNTDGTVAQNDYVDYTNIQLEEGNQATTYEPYKENQVLIDMSKENLISTNENGWSQGTFNQGVETSSTIRIRNNDFIPMVKSSYSYTLEDTNYVYQAIICYKNDYTYLSEISGISGKTSGTFNVPTNCSYVRIVMKKSNNGTILPSEIATIKPKFYEGSITPYHELCKIGDYKDTLSIDSSGNCVINKNIGKVLLNGSEGWVKNSYNNLWYYRLSFTAPNQADGYSNYFDFIPNTESIINYDNSMRIRDNNIDLTFDRSGDLSLANFKTWLSTHNTDVYYVLATPEAINLSSTKIPLYEGINHVTFVDGLESDTKVFYYRKTPLSGTYATVTQLNEVSTEKTQEIQTVRKELLFEVSNERVRINAINETIDESGVPIVKTDTGYTFDIDGMKIEKSENDVSTIVDNDGLVVSYKTREILTARSSGVEAENITTRKFYVQKPIRMEKTKSISDGSSIGLGFFYVGE